MLKRSRRPLVGDGEELHRQVFAHELFCGREIGNRAAVDEVRREVSGLISQEVVLIDTLP
ncbi:MAG: hypothetical protein ACREFO_07530 [Acetobacteraceae bacterium]